jgi:HEXXH motif-containing protein
MKPGRHRIPEELLFALAAGGGGAEAAGHLRAAQAGKRLLLLRGVRDAARAVAHPQAGQAERAFTQLAAIQEQAPEAVDTVVGYPTVGAWARRNLLALIGRAAGEADPGGLAALTAAAAIRARLACEIEVPVRDDGIVLPSLGRALTPARKSALVRSGTGPAEVTATGLLVRIPDDPHTDAPGWQALRRLTAMCKDVQVGFLLDDHDPDRMPGAAVTERRLSETELDRWRSALDGAWEILVGEHWTTSAEITAMITVLTPLVALPDRRASGTPRHAFGNIGLSTPPDAHSFAETLAHEIQHTKLTALLDVVQLTLPDDGSRHYAPWRDDPRPVAGLLQGTYAYLGVTGFWRRQRHHESGERELRAHGDFARWRDAVGRAARTLGGSGRLTELGELFVAEMTRTLHSWSLEPVPYSALSRASAATDRHRTEWRLRNGLPAEG